jgi:Carboxypeptidase regulatory-like domain/TonB dependent receptor
MLRLKIVVLAILVLLVSGIALAQTGSIQGTVTDKSGAVVQGAEVTVRNLATNAMRVISTSGAGTYSVTNLPVGDYEITIKKDSFKASHVDKVTVSVAQVLTADAALEAGTVSEEVQVRGDQLPPVDVETSQVSNLVDARKMQDLPLILRDPYQLILLSPGTIQSNTGLGGFSVNGASERNNNFLLDGTDNNDTSVPGIPGGLASLNPDATEEFRVITNNFMPEFGRNDGAIVDIVTKSGTNNLHGAAYWFGRYNALGARDYFNHGPDPQDPTKIAPMNPYVRNLFGFSVGGPIYKNKTFFFVNSDWQRFRTTLTESLIVPSHDFKTGVFSFNGTPVNLASTTSAQNFQGYPLDPTTQKLLSKYPDPNGPAVDDVRGLYFFPSKSSYNANNITAKLDQHFNDRETLYVRGAYNKSSDPDAFHDEFLPGLGATGFTAHVTAIAAGLTSTLKPTLVNDVKFGVNKTNFPFNCGNVSTINSFGAIDPYGRGRDYVMPASIGSSSAPGFGCLALGDSDGQSRSTGTWSVSDSLSWVRGGHTMKFGGEYRRVFEDGFDNFSSRDALTFAGFTDFQVPSFNMDPANPCQGPGDPNFQNDCGSSTLQNMAWMLFGVADTQTQGQFFNKSLARVASDNRRFRQHEYGFFVQDSWKVRANLTLNFGARYQFNGVPYEQDGNLSNLYVPANGTAPFTFHLAGPGSGRLLYNNDFSMIEPRVGFSWDPTRDGKTAIRGAFGIFHDRVFGNLFGDARSNPPFQQTYSASPFDTPENLGFGGTLPSTPVVQQSAFISIDQFDNHLRMPTTDNWNFGIQRELLRDLTIDVNYVGTKGTHLLRVVDGNPPDPALVQQLLNAGIPASQLQFAALYVGAEFFGFPFDAVHNNAFLNPSSFSGGGAVYNRSIGNSNYNGLEVNVNKRISAGFQIQGSYTYSHSITDVADPFGNGVASGNRSFPRNSYALYNERGNSDFDIRQRLAVNYTYELPIGRGKSHLNSGFAGRALEGWQWSGITTYQAGHPYDVFYNVDVEHTGLSGRGTLISNAGLPAGHLHEQTGPPLTDFCVLETPTPCQPPFGVPGSVGRNHFTGPGFADWDMVLSKRTSITEKASLQFRFEVFNIFNRVQFAQPDNLLQDTSQFGFSSGTLSQNDGTTTARQVQFGLKLMF